MKKYLILCLLLKSSISFANNQAIILTYHGISNVKNSMNISPELFDQHMEYLKTHNYSVIPIKTLVYSMINKTPLPPKSVVLTFDDGWKNQNIAMNTLKSFDFPATFALVTSFQKINSKTDLQKEDFLKYKEQKFTYVNHSFTHNTHKILNNPKEDINQSEKILIDLFGSVEPYYIYPYGIRTAKLDNTLKEHNYIATFGVNPIVVNTEKTSLYNIPRFLVNDKTTIDKLSIILNKLSTN